MSLVLKLYPESVLFNISLNGIINPPKQESSESLFYFYDFYYIFQLCLLSLIGSITPCMERRC